MNVMRTRFPVILMLIVLMFMDPTSALANQVKC